MLTPKTISTAPEERAARKRPRWVSWIVELALVVIIVKGVGWFQSRHLPPTGEPAPAVTFTDLQGQRHTLDELRGKHTLLHFWATWCGVCKMEHGTLNAVHADLDDDQALVAIAADGDDVAHLKAHIAEAGIEYPVWIADRGAVEAFKVKSFPTNFYLDPEGLLSSRDVGMSSRWGVKSRLGCEGGF
ncbi:MAG: TlpA family protein disulfide reductase [Bradymonadia bacterium]